MQILTSIALQFLYAATKAWQGFRVALRTLKIVAFLCKLTAGLTLLPTTTAELVLRLNGLNDHRVQQRLSSFVLRLLRVSRLNGRQVTLPGSFRLRPQRVSWLSGGQGTPLDVCFETTMGQLAQWPSSNTTWFVFYATTTGQLAQIWRTMKNRPRPG